MTSPFLFLSYLNTTRATDKASSTQRTFAPWNTRDEKAISLTAQRIMISAMAHRKENTIQQHLGSNRLVTPFVVDIEYPYPIHVSFINKTHTYIQKKTLLLVFVL